MDKPVSKERIIHILAAIHHIKLFIDGIDESQFAADIKLQSAVQYQFLIIGEAVRTIDPDILARYDYPWHIVRTFRNFIIHQYHNVKIERIYYAANDLDALQEQLNLILKSEF